MNCNSFFWLVRIIIVGILGWFFRKWLWVQYSSLSLYILLTGLVPGLIEPLLHKGWSAGIIGWIISNHEISFIAKVILLEALPNTVTSWNDFRSPKRLKIRLPLLSFVYYSGRRSFSKRIRILPGHKDCLLLSGTQKAKRFPLDPSRFIIKQFILLKQTGFLLTDSPFSLPILYLHLI